MQVEHDDSPRNARFGPSSSYLRSRCGQDLRANGVPTLRVYEKLRQSLGEFAGVAGFQSLASRALALARTEAPSLGAARVTADGSLQGLGEIEHQIDIDKDQLARIPAGEGGIILIARLLGCFVSSLAKP
jgi:hypothetical protein